MRTEHDSMGEMQVPRHALYGAQTRRAELNFPISGRRMPAPFIRALARIKRAAARVNCELGLLSGELAGYIEQAATEIIEGEHAEQFVVDVFQTGSGTSTNMNMNEVIANRAIQLSGGRVGSKKPVHPNDHVNLGQSSNDTIPAALHIAIAVSLARDLLPAMDMLSQVLGAKAEAFYGVIKIGRTHLQDATPIRMGQVFSGYRTQAEDCRTRMEACTGPLSELALGGTAVGTGLNAHPEFGARVAAALAAETGIAFCEARDHFSAQATKDAVVMTAAALKTSAISIAKIANDIRLLGSGPRCGLGELRLPEIQPGSSIMPGKVNPVICESMMQVSAFVVGADAAIAHAAATLSNFELCVAMPLMAHELLEAMRIMANACRTFCTHCLQDLEVETERCNEQVERSLAMCTALAPVIGYDRAAAIAKEAYTSGRTVREVAMEQDVMEPEKLTRLLDPAGMTDNV